MQIFELNQGNPSEGVQLKNHEDLMNIGNWRVFTLICKKEPGRSSRICKLVDFRAQPGLSIRGGLEENCLV